MAIIISFGKKTKTTSGEHVEEVEDVVDKIQSIFSKRNVTLLLAGVALGVVLKQQSEIHTLKRTIDILQEVVR